MKRNKRLLLKTAQRIEDIPASYDQGTFADHNDASPCGTVACLAGEIVICSERSVAKGIKKLFELDQVGRVAYAACALTGLTDNERHTLFYNTDSWPKPFATRWDAAKTQRGRANAAAALLRYVAEGGEV